jgi:hypothetical protein
MAVTPAAGSASRSRSADATSSGLRRRDACSTRSVTTTVPISSS